MAVHKRVAFHLPGDLTLEFVWLAESMIDEFRCERALHEKGVLDPGVVPDPDEYSKVVALFDEVRDSCNHGPDIITACQHAFAVLERFGTLLSYAAASVVTNPGAGPPWTPMTPTAGLAGTLSHLPGATSIMRDEQLASTSLGLAWLLREVFQEMGFDYRLLPDGSKQFELLRRMD
jgi:hypothetical protein